jgi:hypothetical protein
VNVISMDLDAANVNREAATFSRTPEPQEGSSYDAEAGRTPEGGRGLRESVEGSESAPQGDPSDIHRTSAANRGCSLLTAHLL